METKQFKTPWQELCEVLTEKKKKECWVLLRKLKRTYRFMVCEAVLKRIRTGKKTKFGDIWLEGWSQSISLICEDSIST